MLKTKYTKEYRALAARLRQARRELKLTQCELAERMAPTCGLDADKAQLQRWRYQRYISLCEQGEKRLDLLQLFHYCKHLELDFAEFINDLTRDWQEFGLDADDEFAAFSLDPF